MTITTAPANSPRAGPGRPTRPYPELAAEMLRWSEIGRREGSRAPRRKGRTGPEHPRRGRPSKLGPDVLSRFLMAIRAGDTREGAARFAGISSATLYRWLRDRRPRFARFRRLLSRAELEVKMMVTTNLYRLALRETRAAVFWLQTRYPEDWPSEGRRRR